MTASPLASAPTFWEVVDLVTYTQGVYPWNSVDHVLWPNMMDAAAEVASGDYEERFEDLSLAYGVYNDGP